MVKHTPLPHSTLTSVYWAWRRLGEISEELQKIKEITFFLVIWVIVCKFPNQFNTIVLSYTCKLFFQRVLLSLSSLNSILFPLRFEKLVSISSSQLNKAPAVITTFRCEEAEPLCGLTPPLSFWITGEGRATSTCRLQNHRCLFFFP